MLYNFYCYHLTREKDDKSDTDEWRVYVIKANSDRQASEEAERHASALNAELAADRQAQGKPPLRLYKRWGVETYFKFDMGQINKGFPVLIASFNIPSDDYHVASNM